MSKAKSKRPAPVMVFWANEDFPYLLSGRGTPSKFNKGMHFIENDLMDVHAKFTLPMQDGLKLQAELGQLERERDETIESIEEGFQARLLATLTAHGK